MKEEGSIGGSELHLGSNLDPDPWKVLWIRIRQNDGDPLDLDPQPDVKSKKNSLNVEFMF